MAKVNGRPLKYKTPEELQSQIDLYKIERNGKSLPYTKQSLTLFLGFFDYHALDDTYLKKPEFSPTIKKMWIEIESSKIDYAFGDEGSTTFAIFDLKCNHGFNDRKAEQADNEVDVIGFDFVEVKPDAS